MNLIHEGKLEEKGLTFHGAEPTPMPGSQPVSPATTTSFNSSSGNTHLSALLRQNGFDLDVSGPINGAHEQTTVESEDNSTTLRQVPNFGHAHLMAALRNSRPRAL